MAAVQLRPHPDVVWRRLENDVVLDPGADPATTVLAGYRSSGPAALNALRGIFFVVIHDEQNDTVVCARDPLGIYPLFYAEVGDELLASPFIGTLVEDQRVPKV